MNLRVVAQAYLSLRARAGVDMNIFLLSRSESWHEQTIYRASGVKLFLCGHEKGRRDLSAKHFMRMSVGYGGPASGQAARRGSCDANESSSWLRRPGPWPGAEAVTQSMSACQ